MKDYDISDSLLSLLIGFNSRNRLSWLKTQQMWLNGCHLLGGNVFINDLSLYVNGANILLFANDYEMLGSSPAHSSDLCSV